jgi:thiazole synthase ThiGH ThiG subunit
MLRIADKTFESHLFTGTGKFAAPEVMVEAIRASGSQLVTLAMKRVDLRQHNDAILAPLLAAGSACCRIPQAPRRRKRRCLPPAWRGKPWAPTG